MCGQRTPSVLSNRVRRALMENKQRYRAPARCSDTTKVCLLLEISPRVKSYMNMDVGLVVHECECVSIIYLPSSNSINTRCTHTYTLTHQNSLHPVRMHEHCILNVCEAAHNCPIGQKLNMLGAVVCASS